MTSFHQTGFLIDTFIIKLKSWRLLENITGSYIIKYTVWLFINTRLYELDDVVRHSCEKGFKLCVSPKTFS